MSASNINFDYSQVPEYDENSFWSLVKKQAKKLGSNTLVSALTLFYSMQDSQTPQWAKAVIVSSLAYLIFPADAIPDIIPVIGWTDDIAMLATTSATVAMHILPEHIEKAKKKVDNLLG